MLVLLFSFLFFETKEKKPFMSESTFFIVILPALAIWLFLLYFGIIIPFRSYYCLEYNENRLRNGYPETFNTTEEQDRSGCCHFGTDECTECFFCCCLCLAHCHDT